MGWSVDGEPRLHVVGSHAGHVQPGPLGLIAISDDAGVAALACGTGLEVLELRAGVQMFATAKGKKVLAALGTSRDGSVLAGFASLSEKTKRVVVYTRGPKGYRGSQLAASLGTGPSTISRDPNLAISADGSRVVTVEGRVPAEAVVLDTASGQTLARLPLGSLAARGGPTPSGAWRLTRDGRLWTVNATDHGSELTCRSLDEGTVITSRHYEGPLVIEDESPAGRLALLAPRSPWAQRDPIADAIVVDRDANELLRVEARDGALRFEGDDALSCLPAHPYLSVFQVVPETALRLDLRGGPTVTMPGAAAVARVTTHPAAARAVIGDVLLVSDGHRLWELGPDGRTWAAHTCDALDGPTRRVDLAVRGDRVLLVADHDGSLRTTASPGPSTIVTVLAPS